MDYISYEIYFYYYLLTWKKESKCWHIIPDIFRRLLNNFSLYNNNMDLITYYNLQWYLNNKTYPIGSTLKEQCKIYNQAKHFL